MEEELIVEKETLEIEGGRKLYNYTFRVLARSSAADDRAPKELDGDRGHEDVHEDPS